MHPIPQRILQGLTLLSFIACTHTALARDPAWQTATDLGPYAVARDADQMRWMCEYMHAPDGVLYMYCEDVVSLMFDDLTLEGDPQPAAAKYFPLWGTPRSERNAIELAELLLCPRQHSRCSVELARGASPQRVALF